MKRTSIKTYYNVSCNVAHCKNFTVDRLFHLEANGRNFCII